MVKLIGYIKNSTARILFENNGVIILLLIIIITIRVYPDAVEFLKQPFNEKELTLLIGGGAAALAFFMTRYLSGTSQSLVNQIKLKEFDYIRLLSKDVQELRKQRDLLSEDERGQLVDSIKARIHEETADHVLKSMQEKIQHIEDQQKLLDRTKNTLARIYDEISSLGRRGAINLVLGVFTAIIGVSTLSMFVLFDSKEHASIESFAIAFLPRLSIVLIIEVFSYFFLRLYKSSLAEIKYFQNEATNIELNFIALETALRLKDKELTKRALIKLIDVERNPVLTKNQSTREIMLEEISSNQTRYSADQLVEIVKIFGRNQSKTDKETNNA